MELKITSRKNAFIQQVRRLLTSRKERQSAGLFVADGTKLLQEAIRFWDGLDTVILTEGVEVQVPNHVRVVTVSQEIMEYISPMETPQGALFLCKLPQQTDFAPKPGMLLLDGIQDPGNIGTILRTADALDIPVALLEDINVKMGDMVRLSVTHNGKVYFDEEVLYHRSFGYVAPGEPICYNAEGMLLGFALNLENFMERYDTQPGPDWLVTVKKA